MVDQTADDEVFVAKVVEGDPDVTPETNSEQDERSDARAAALAPIVEAKVTEELTVFAQHVVAAMEDQARTYKGLLAAAVENVQPIIDAAAAERVEIRKSLREVEKEATRKKRRELVLIGLASLLVVLGLLPVFGIHFFL